MSLPGFPKLTKNEKIFLFSSFVITIIFWGGFVGYYLIKLDKIVNSETTPIDINAHRFSTSSPFAQLSVSPPPTTTQTQSVTPSEGLDTNGVYYPKKSFSETEITWKKFQPKEFDLIINIPSYIGAQKIILYPLDKPVIPSKRAWILQNALGGEITRLYLSPWQHKDAENEFGLIFEQVENENGIKYWKANNKNKGIVLVREQKGSLNVWLNIFYEKSPLDRSGTNKILIEIIKSLR
jgi:hypothetical protein